MARKSSRNVFKLPPHLRHVRRIISAYVDGGPSGGSSVSRPGSGDPHQREQKLCVNVLTSLSTNMSSKLFHLICYSTCLFSYYPQLYDPIKFWYNQFEHFKLPKLHFNWALSYSYKFRVGKTGWQPDLHKNLLIQNSSPCFPLGPVGLWQNERTQKGS